MLDFLKSVGLESATPVQHAHNNAGDLDILNATCDVAITLLEGSIEEQMDSIDYNTVAVASMIGNESTAVKFLEATGIAGVESLKEMGARTWYRLKALGKAVLSAVIKFFSKFTSIGLITDKAMRKLKDKHEAFEKRYTDNIGKVKFDDAKKYSTTIQSLNEILSAKLEMEPGKAVSMAEAIEELMSMIIGYKILTDVSLKEFFKKVTGSKKDPANKNTKSAYSDGIARNAEKDSVAAKDLQKLKDRAAKKLSNIKSKDIKFGEFRTTVKSALDTIGKIATKLEDAEIMNDAKEAKSNAEGLLKEINQLKEEDIAETLGGIDVQLASDAISGIIKTLNDLPAAFSVTIKTILTVSDKVFTETEKLLAI